MNPAITGFSRLLRLPLILVLAIVASAQDSRDPGEQPWDHSLIPTEFKTLEERYAAPISPMKRSAEDILRVTQRGALPNVMLTGYWPPTNEMLRQWSTNVAQNPGGWTGADWESYGFNIYSFFPEFPQGFGRGSGDFEVDYQDTSADWFAITAIVKPAAIITFSRASNNHDWEMEGGNRTYIASQWTVDYLAPLQPTPDLPIMQLEPPLTERFSTHPMQAIVDAVNAQVPTLNSFISPIDNGRFLSNFIGYHGNWYRDMHSDLSDPAWCVDGGHIHVGYAMTVAEAVHATEVTLRTVLPVVAERLSIGDLNCDGLLSVADIGGFVLALTDPSAYAAAFPGCNIARADTNRDGFITVADIGGFVNLLVN